MIEGSWICFVTLQELPSLKWKHASCYPCRCHALLASLISLPSSRHTASILIVNARTAPISILIIKRCPDRTRQSFFASSTFFSMVLLLDRYCIHQVTKDLASLHVKGKMNCMFSAGGHPRPAPLSQPFKSEYHLIRCLYCRAAPGPRSKTLPG